MKHIILTVVCLLPFFVEGQQQIPPHPNNYVCYVAVDDIQIDGFLNENSWQAAQWTDNFMDIEGPAKEKPTYQTKVKILWDSEYLYLAAYLQETHIWATLTERESIIYFDNDFEIFIDPVPDNHHYAEIEINAFGTIMDLLLARPYRNYVVPSFGWDCKGLKKAIQIQGTINNPNERDTSWTIEMAIPLKSISDLVNLRVLPKAGDQWRINFSRVQWDTKIVEGKYVKVDSPEHNWVWSPQWAINMHRPEYWGYLQFSAIEVGKGKESFKPDPIWKEKMQIMAVYEAEEIFREEKGKYTSSLKDLSTPYFIDDSKIKIEAGSRQFTVFYDLGNSILMVDNTSKLWLEEK
ncbi:MAG: carbohydrate-binding family 9-like protein [Bacteroidales bacterium]|nr:carbohydrate-binding family 9-like protein [Bacteroidales bacterium]MCF8455999.1 carbohydrate-binding family 9-like protein [Bacteroidales bacterium]